MNQSITVYHLTRIIYTPFHYFAFFSLTIYQPIVLLNLKSLSFCHAIRKAVAHHFITIYHFFSTSSPCRTNIFRFTFSVVLASHPKVDLTSGRSPPTDSTLYFLWITLVPKALVLCQEKYAKPKSFLWLILQKIKSVKYFLNFHKITQKYFSALFQD